jgi:hypothetical protein
MMDRLLYQAFDFFCQPFEFHLVSPPPPLSSTTTARKVLLPPFESTDDDDDDAAEEPIVDDKSNEINHESDSKLTRFELTSNSTAECALCRDVLEHGAVFRLDCSTGLSHRFHLVCLGQMLQRPYAHACGLCFAPISLDDSTRIRLAFDDEKRTNRQMLSRLRDEFDDLYLVPTGISSTASPSSGDKSPQSEPPQNDKPVDNHENIVDDSSLFIPDGSTCRCGQTQQLAPSATDAPAAWNWCPTCEVFVGDGMVTNCKCGDAEPEPAEPGVPLEWLRCDACEQYSHLSCWPDQVGLPDDVPFLCQQCGPVPPSPPMTHAPPPTPASQSVGAISATTTTTNTITPEDSKKRKVIQSIDENSSQALSQPKRINARRGRRAADFADDADFTCLM